MLGWYFFLTALSFIANPFLMEIAGGSKKIKKKSSVYNDFFHTFDILEKDCYTNFNHKESLMNKFNDLWDRFLGVIIISTGWRKYINEGIGWKSRTVAPLWSSFPMVFGGVAESDLSQVNAFAGNAHPKMYFTCNECSLQVFFDRKKNRISGCIFDVA